MIKLDPTDYYVTLLGLNQQEREKFKALTLEFVEGVVDHYAFYVERTAKGAYARHAGPPVN